MLELGNDGCRPRRQPVIFLRSIVTHTANTALLPGGVPPFSRVPALLNQLAVAHSRCQVTSSSSDHPVSRFSECRI